MEVLAFFPCEYVVMRWDGSHDVGRFGIEALTLPPGGPVLASLLLGVVAWLNFTPAEAGDHVIEIRWIDNDGQTTTSPVMLPVRVSPQGTTPVRHAGPFVITANGPGHYALVLLVDRAEQKRWSVEILAPPSVSL